MKALSDDGFFAKLGYEIVLSKEGTPGNPLAAAAAATRLPRDRRVRSICRSSA